MSDGLWKLVGFQEYLDYWIASDKPSQDLVCVVAAWMVGRVDDPYQGMVRESSMPNLWYGPVPGSDEGGMVVVCSYFVEESTRTVKCIGLATLSRPI